MNNVLDIGYGLLEFWKKQGCDVILPYDYPMSAGTFHPDCVFGSFKDKINIAYMQPCRRKCDGRYGKSPNRFFKHHQVEVLINPAPINSRELYFKSLEYIGIDTDVQDFKFIENNWENTSLGAIGVGWEVWCNTMEITQWTYFDKIGDIELKHKPLELAYGLERVALQLLEEPTILNCRWNNYNSYKFQFQQQEYEYSTHIFQFDTYTDEDFDHVFQQAQLAIKNDLCIPGYELLLQMNEVFNGLDAKGKIEHLRRKNYIDKMRYIANGCCRIYVKQNQLNY